MIGDKKTPMPDPTRVFEKSVDAILRILESIDKKVDMILETGLQMRERRREGQR